MLNETAQDLRILILAPTLRDAEITGGILKRENIDFHVCGSISDVCAEMRKGAGAALVPEEFLVPDTRNIIKDFLERQSPWSDFPLLVLTSNAQPPAEVREKINSLPHMILIRRPVQVAELVSTIRSALRDRARQYEVRKYLQEREKQTQELIAERDNAKLANLAKTEFLANMSHEIRTPMNAVMGLSQILSMSKPLTDKQREYIKTLQLSANSLLCLINDLLDISKIEARTVELENIPFNLTQLVREIVSIISVQAKHKNLEFVINGNLDEDSIFVSDPTRLRQILINLCSNAVKFTDQGTITLTINGCPTDNRNVKLISIQVKDTGIGIHSDKIDTIFQKFVQADGSINRRYGGTGLGLAITKTLTEIMGGHITVHSEFGNGSKFCVDLPLQVAGHQKIERSPLELPSENPLNIVDRGRVLLVEDYDSNVLVAGTFLDQFGYSYDVACDGAQALRKLETEEFLAVLMDVQMPVMNGLDATRAIRRLEREEGISHIPIIGMTAHALSNDRQKCIEAGMDDYISKPFSAQELKLKLQNYIQQLP